MQQIVIIVLIGYLVGSISFSYILGKYFKGLDIRNHGSGNAGATNALRILGKKMGAVTLLLDGLKGVIAILIGSYILGENGALIAGVSAVVGHNWSIFLGFKGGKGVATTFAAIMTIEPLIGIVLVVIGILIIIKTKYVSLASITGMALFPIIGLVVVRPFDLYFLIFALILALMSIYRHKGNIERLIAGNESKIGKKV